MRPPTDNLYKFLALSGLLLFGFCIYTPLQKLDQLAEGDANLTAARAGVTEAKSKLTDYDNLRTIDCPPGVKVPIGRLIDCADWLKEAKAAADAATSALPGLQEKENEASARSTFLNTQYSRYVFVCWLGVVIGAVSAIFGFIWWYSRLQRFLDKATARGELPEKKPSGKEDAQE